MIRQFLTVLGWLEIDLNLQNRYTVPDLYIIHARTLVSFFPLTIRNPAKSDHRVLSGPVNKRKISVSYLAGPERRYLKSAIGCSWRHLSAVEVIGAAAVLRVTGGCGVGAAFWSIVIPGALEFIYSAIEQYIPYYESNYLHGQKTLDSPLRCEVFPWFVFTNRDFFIYWYGPIFSNFLIRSEIKQQNHILLLQLNYLLLL